MKIKLLVLSLSPLAVLTIIRNFSFVTNDSMGTALSFRDLVSTNSILIVVMLACIFWALCATFYYISFNAFKWNDKKSGYEITLLEDKEDASLNFFLTLIIPLLIDDVDTIQGALTFGLIFFIISLLLYRTSLFYANPILALLGYRVYIFSFKENAEFGHEKCIGLCQGLLVDDSSIEYKIITGNVLYIRRMKNDRR